MKLSETLITLFIGIIIASCGTSKGYVGDKIPANELAILNGSVNPINIDGKKHKERLLFVKSNQKEVGSKEMEKWKSEIYEKEKPKIVQKEREVPLLILIQKGQFEEARVFIRNINKHLSQNTPFYREEKIQSLAKKYFSDNNYEAGIKTLSINVRYFHFI